ncbi:hypothetical protein PoMZ_05141 [Pyricularia oryzae]|uniref:Uncharacterized protein n=1 Tax=Pyricularia oryzae TaxID=318829 RepID=A0A4P7NMW4_PYROR|nr:hypothetical protein PoMZ_05141 [Pyricularia oryzae]
MRLSVNRHGQFAKFGARSIDLFSHVSNHKPIYTALAGYNANIESKVGFLGELSGAKCRDGLTPLGSAPRPGCASARRRCLAAQSGEAGAKQR